MRRKIQRCNIYNEVFLRQQLLAQPLTAEKLHQRSEIFRGKHFFYCFVNIIAAIIVIIIIIIIVIIINCSFCYVN